MDPTEELVVARCVEARRQHIQIEPVTLDISTDQALALQLRVAATMAEPSSHIAGWKIGMTSGPSRDAMGQGFRPFGFVLDHDVHDDGASVAFDAFAAPGIEPELVLIMGDDLEGSVDREAAAAAVETVAAGFELLDARIAGRGPEATTSRLVDGLSCGGMVIGTGTGPESFEPMTTCHLTCDGIERALVTTADVGIDDVYASLVALVAQLAKHSLAVERGQAILTGAYVKVPVDGPGHWKASFAGIGDVDVTYV